jgi:hypothetical protein
MDRDQWGAAYLANGGCSDDGFDYFRGWLIGQGRKCTRRSWLTRTHWQLMPMAATGGRDGAAWRCRSAWSVRT